MTFPQTFELATTDKLTSLFTPDYFRFLVREQVLPAMHERVEPLSMFVLDIDYFLALNTESGRECGDAVLVAVAQVLKRVLPEQALLSRYSGDEFAGALPELRIDDAFSLLEEVRRQVWAIQLECLGEIKLSCSIGLASYPGHGRDEVELVRQADEALYHAKTTGRNKIALPVTDSRMITKTSYYTTTQLERLAQLAKALKRNEASLLREALDDVIKKYNDRLKS